MAELLIGCGGWAYFQVPGLKPLDAYARAFNFVEVNSTFYEIPNLQVVRSWRRRVPPDFEFAVRCHKDVTHRYQLEPTEEAFQAFNSVVEICNILGSKFLVLQTASEMRFSHEKIENMKDFLESVNLKGARLVWEIRRRGGEALPSEAVALMRDYDIVHCVDLSRENPITESDTVYTRVFGKGEHNVYQFEDGELQEIDEKIVGRGSETAAVSFHNVRMYKDAARFKIYKDTGRFSSVTGAEGQESLRKVLMEDASFPTTKTKLVKDQGWKVIDLSAETRVHAHTLLDRLPNRQFGSIEEVIQLTKKLGLFSNSSRLPQP